MRLDLCIGCVYLSKDQCMFFVKPISDVDEDKGCPLFPLGIKYVLVDVIALTRVIEYLHEEEKHWEESDKPKNHIWNDVLKLKQALMDREGGI